MIFQWGVRKFWIIEKEISRRKWRMPSGIVLKTPFWLLSQWWECTRFQQGQSLLCKASFTPENYLQNLSRIASTYVAIKSPYKLHCQKEACCVKPLFTNAELFTLVAAMDNHLCALHHKTSSLVWVYWPACLASLMSDSVIEKKQFCLLSSRKNILTCLHKIFWLALK